jgi:O-antigen/teichoic acid export membrane protein
LLLEMAVRTSIAFSVGAQAITLVAMLSSSVVLARLLTPYEMGVYAVAVAVAGIIAIFQSLGLNNQIIRDPDLSPERLGTILAIILLQALGLCALVFLISWPASTWLAEPGVGNVLRIMAGTAALNVLSTFPGGLLERSLRYGWIALGAVMSAVINSGLTIWLAFGGFSYMSFAYASFCAATLNLAILAWASRAQLGVRPTLSLWRSTLSFSANILAVSAMATSIQRLPDLLLGRMLGLAPLGVFSRASEISAMISRTAIPTLTRILFSALAEYYRQCGQVGPAYRRVILLMTGLFWPAFAGLAVLATPTISLLFGAQWTTAGPLLSILCLAIIIQLLQAFTWETFIVMGAVKHQTKLEAYRTAADLALFVVATWKFGLLGAAWSRVASAVFTIMIYNPSMRRMTAVTTRELAQLHWASLLPTLAAIAPAVVVMAVRDWPDQLAMIELFAAIALGVLAWAVTIYATKHQLRDEVVQALELWRAQRAGSPAA